MSPHKVDVLPSPLALASYGISENGFLPAEAPLRRLAHAFYEPWERVMDQLPLLLKAGCVRECVDALPVLGTVYLENEQELQRAYSMLAMIAQAYIWQGPKPSEVSVVCSDHLTSPDKLTSTATASSDLSTLPASCSSFGSPTNRNILSAEPLELERASRRQRPSSSRQPRITTHLDRNR